MLCSTIGSTSQESHPGYGLEVIVSAVNLSTLMGDRQGWPLFWNLPAATTRFVIKTLLRAAMAAVLAVLPLTMTTPAHAAVTVSLP